jgi:hypothetical protein
VAIVLDRFGGDFLGEAGGEGEAPGFDDGDGVERGLVGEKSGKSAGSAAVTGWAGLFPR